MVRPRRCTFVVCSVIVSENVLRIPMIVPPSLDVPVARVMPNVPTHLWVSGSVLKSASVPLVSCTVTMSKSESREPRNACLRVCGAPAIGRAPKREPTFQVATPKPQPQSKALSNFIISHPVGSSLQGRRTAHDSDGAPSAAAAICRPVLFCNRMPVSSNKLFMMLMSM